VARELRVHFENALYHVIVRGNNKFFVFNECNWKEEYIKIVLRYKIKFNFKIYAYCIMDNHAHILIEVGKTELSKIMKCIQQVFTQKFNREMNRSGHVFEQRYKAVLCDRENYLISLIRYIHLNPLVAGVTKEVSYHWSSHNDYIKGKSELVDIDRVFEMLTTNKGEGINEYLDMMNLEKLDDNVDYRLSKEDLNIKLENIETASIEKIEIFKLIEKICIQENIEISEVKTKRRIRKLSNLRKAIILLSEKYCNVRNKELAKELNLDASMVSKIKNESEMKNKEVDNIVNRFENK